MSNKNSLYKRISSNEIVEDYSLRYAPRAFRRWSPAMVASASLGSIAALFPFAISASLVNLVGTQSALIGNIVAMVLCVIVSIPIANAIAKHNVDMDLLTRGAGFGYIGSTITSLIYATFTIIYFAFEGSIVAQGITGTFGIPLQLSYLISALAVIPMVMFGMTFLSKLQTYTWPIWIVLLLLPIFIVGTLGHFGTAQWISFSGLKKAGGPLVDAAAIGLVAGALISLLVQIGEQADYLRFMKNDEDCNVKSKRFWTFMSGPGYALFFVVSFTAGTYLASFTSRHIGINSNDPFSSFLYAYSIVFPHWLGVTLAFLLIVVAQVKINVINAYSGSLSWSNFFSRILHHHYGRFTWLLMQVGIGLLLMELNVFTQMAALLGFYSNVAVAWIVAVFADIVINRKLLHIGPSWVEFRRGYMHNINPVGFVSMVVASVISIAAYFGVLGSSIQPYSPFLSGVIALLLVPIIAIATKGKYYLKRSYEDDIHINPESETHICVVCNNEYETPDTLGCSFYAGSVCSLCCTTESNCHDSCKDNMVIIYSRSSVIEKQNLVNNIEG